jgi:putative FmdB family regulatory protein
MPLYEYECDNCAHRFEVIQKFSDAHIAVCPKCGGGPVQKLMSSPAIQFKGSGFYLTDYGRGTSSKSENAKAGKSDKGDTGAKGDKGDSGASGGTDSSKKSESASSGESKASTSSDTSSAKSTPTTPAKSD